MFSIRSAQGSPRQLRKERTGIPDSVEKLAPFRPLTKPAESSRRMNGGHSVPRCNFGHQLLDQLAARGLSTRSIWCARVRQSTMFPACRVTQEPRRRGDSEWQRTTASASEQRAGAYGTVRMPESRGHGTAPRSRSIAAYRRWSPIPQRRIPFSQVAIQACS
jgi:hypothetical protein